MYENFRTEQKGSSIIAEVTCPLTEKTCTSPSVHDGQGHGLASSLSIACTDNAPFLIWCMFILSYIKLYSLLTVAPWVEFFLISWHTSLQLPLGKFIHLFFTLFSLLG